jgi:N6-adenosine-specific RNA methylase IME4
VKIHPAAELFPLLPDADLQRLADNIKARGLLHPIVTLNGAILDGRNRHAACKLAQTEPRSVEYRGKDPVGYVVSANLHRRHLDESQRAMVGARVRGMYEADAKERQRKGVPANLREGGTSAAKAAAAVNVSPRSVEDAVTVLAVPAVAAAVDAGRLAVSVAAKLVHRPASEQKSTLAALADGSMKPREVLGKLKLNAKNVLAEQIRANPVPTPDGRYRVIAMDPPWKYDSRAEDTTHRGRNGYPDMTVEEICALPVAKLAEDNCILWLWTTNAFMREAYACLDAWGFQSKTILTWDKQRMGLGDWLRNVTEHCIVAVRGRPLVTLTNQTTLISEARREHSRKPDAFYALVDRLCPGSKLEMFSRTERAGWTAWGAESGRFVA